MEIIFLLKCFYLMLPAYFSNMAPVIIRDLNLFNFLAKPVDFGIKIKGKPVLGKHKTFRGFIFGIIFALIIAYIQNILYRYDFFSKISFINYSNWIAVGLLLGFGALFGDSVKSFFKRRFDLKPGEKFIPWDQIDYTLGALLFIAIIFMPSWQIVLISVILSFVLHILVNHIGYYLGLREVKW